MTTALRREAVPASRVWWRIAHSSWNDPLDPNFARRHGNLVTARLNLRTFIAGWPYEPEDLRDDTGPVLVGARAKAEGRRGVRARSAQSRDGTGRELAWFPATERSAGRRVRTLSFAEWFRS